MASATLADQITGVDQMTALMDEAVERERVGDVTRGLRHALCKLISSDDFELPACVWGTDADHYARRTLYHSESHGYCVMAMTWGPGQGTPIHDHCGMWCVEGVFGGELEVVQYQLLERDGERFRFEPVTTMQAHRGSAGSLIPPHEYHTIANPSASDPAVSIHVYSGEMTSCATFQPEGEDGWYQRVEKSLGCD